MKSFQLSPLLPSNVEKPAKMEREKSENFCLRQLSLSPIVTSQRSRMKWTELSVWMKDKSHFKSLLSSVFQFCMCTMLQRVRGWQGTNMLDDGDIQLLLHLHQRHSWTSCWCCWQRMWHSCYRNAGFILQFIFLWGSHRRWCHYTQYSWEQWCEWHCRDVGFLGGNEQTNQAYAFNIVLGNANNKLILVFVKRETHCHYEAASLSQRNELSTYGKPRS